MGNKLEFNDNIIPWDKHEQIIDFMRQIYPMQDELDDQSLWNKASEIFPEYKFPAWQKNIDEYNSSNYPSDTSLVDITPDAVNNYYSEIENLDASMQDKYKDLTNKRRDASGLVPMTEEQKAIKESLQEQKISPADFSYDVKRFMEENSGETFNLFEPLVAEDSFVSKYIPKEWQFTIKNSINNSRAGLLYETLNKEKKFPDLNPEDYNSNAIHGLVGFAVSHANPIDILSLSLYGPASKTPKFLQWGTKSIYNSVSKYMPKTKFGLKISNEASKKSQILKDMTQKSIENAFGLGTIYASHGILQSTADQRMNRGKYKDNDGTINAWDTMMDGSAAFTDGALTGSIVGFGTGGLGAYAKYAVPRYARGKRDFNTILGKKLSSPVGYAATTGIGFTVTPLAYSEEYRKRYQSTDGGINYGQFFNDLVANTGIGLVYAGVGSLTNPNLRRPRFSDFNKKNFSASLTKKERDILRKKANELRGTNIKKDEAYAKWEKEVLSGDGGSKFLADLIKGKADLPVTFAQKLGTYFGIRPKMPWEKNGIIKGTKLPDDINFNVGIRRIQSQVKKDLNYENKKMNNPNLQSSENALLKSSVKNIANEIGVNTPFEFFDKTYKKDTGSVETYNGLQEILDISNKTVKIIDKISVKDKKGEVIGIDKNKLSDEDALYLNTISPLAIRAYQGYKSQYFDNDAGKEEYIKRFEIEENNGNKLNKQQSDLILNGLENQINQFDALLDYRNKKILYGDTETEQLNVANNLDAKKTKVVAVDEDGNSDNIVLNLDSKEADAGIKQNRLVKVDDPKLKNVDVEEIVSKNFGDNNTALSLISSAVQKGVEKGVEKGVQKGLEDFTPYSGKYNKKSGQFIMDGSRLNVGLNSSAAKAIIITIKGDELINKANNIDNFKGQVDAIKDELDIYALNSLTDDGFRKWVPDANKLLKWTGKENFSSITQADIQNWFDSIKKSPRKKLKGIDTGITTSIRKVFQHLVQQKIVDINPADESMLNRETSIYNELKKAQQKQLPTLKTWFTDVDKLYKKSKNDKDLTFALRIYDELMIPIRNQELNGLRGIHIKPFQMENGSIQYYLDYTTARSFQGGAKAKGIKRPIPIPEKFALELLKHANDNKRINTPVFPNVAKKLTGVSKAVFGKDSNSLAFKRQLKTFVPKVPDLTNEEIDIYNVLAGHATPDKKAIVALYEDQANWNDFFTAANKVMDKIREHRKEFMKEPVQIPPVVSPQQPELGKVGKAVKKVAGEVVKGLKKPGLGIKIVKGDSDKEVIEKISKAKRIPAMEKKLLKRYTQAIKNTFKTYTEGLSKSEAKALMKWFAKNAGIENYSDFKLSIKTSTPDLVLFGNEIHSDLAAAKTKNKNIYRLLAIKEEAANVANALKITADEQTDLLKRMFNKNNILDLSMSEAKDYLKHLNLAATDNQANYWFRDIPSLVFNGDISSRQLLKILTGLGGDLKRTSRKLDILFKTKAFSQASSAMDRHLATESTEGGKFNEFLEKAYLILAPARKVPRQYKVRMKEGEIKFNKQKDNIFYLQLDKFDELAAHVKQYPDDKKGLKEYNNAKKFIDKVYKIEKGDKDIITLRIDTKESELAKAWYEMTNSWKNSLIDALKHNMTEPQWIKYKEKHGIKWIEDSFYVHRRLTPEFMKYVNLNDRSTVSLLRKSQKEIQINLATEKYGQNPTQQQIKEFEDMALIEAKDALATLIEYGTSQVNPNLLIARKLNLPPRIKIGNKFISVWETKFDNYQQQYAAGVAKLIATLRELPFMVNMKGLPGKYTDQKKAFDDMVIKGGAIGSYMKHMFEGRAGLLNASNHLLLKYPDKILNEITHFVSRGHLSWVKSSIKNAGIGQSQSLKAFEAKNVAIAAARALSFEARQKAMGKGIMQLSLSSMEKGTFKFMGKIYDFLFSASRFKSSEQWVRLTDSLAALMELPKLVDGLNSSNPKEVTKWTRISKTKYRMDDRQILLAKTFGLGAVEYGTSIPKGLATERFKKVGDMEQVGDEVIVSSYELAKLQKELNSLHDHIIQWAHISVQSGTAEILQPYLTRQPIIKALMQYSPMAMGALQNSRRFWRMNRKNNHWHRSFIGTAGKVLTGAGLVAFTAFWRGTEKPNELKPGDYRWRKILDYAIKGEFRDYLTPLYAIPLGRYPGSSDFISAASFPQLIDAFELLSDLLIKIPAEKLGLKPEGSGELARFLTRKKFLDQSISDLGDQMFALYREGYKGYLNYKAPYSTQADDLRKWEKEFLKTTPNPKTQVLTNSNMSPFNRAFDEMFERTDNYDQMVKKMMDKFEAHLGNEIQTGTIDYNEAAKKALAKCNHRLKTLDPTAIGMTSDGKLMSKNDDYITFLVERAIDNNKKDYVYKGKDFTDLITGKTIKSGDKRPGSMIYLDKLSKQKTEYNKKIEKFSNVWQKQLSNNPDYAKDEFVKLWRTLKPSNWDDLGIKIDSTGKVTARAIDEIIKLKEKAKK
tara:strand:+ start:1382 stop:8773 length:7392 start_codon:yes stop_codon:yes gene_type:complete